MGASLVPENAVFVFQIKHVEGKKALHEGCTCSFRGVWISYHTAYFCRCTLALRRVLRSYLDTSYYT